MRDDENKIYLEENDFTELNLGDANHSASLHFIKWRFYDVFHIVSHSDSLALKIKENPGKWVCEAECKLYGGALGFLTYHLPFLWLGRLT